jgi:hypothetical protein
MRIHNLYEDADGESHFRDIEVDWVEETPSGKLSKRLPATGVVFRETTTDYENSWHRAPRRQYVISLAGGFRSLPATARPATSAPARSSWSRTPPARATSPDHRATNRGTRSSCRSIDRGRWLAGRGWELNQ